MRFLYASLVAMLCSTSVHAAPTRYVIVPKESKLKFTALKDNLPVEGAFSRFSGEVLIDPENLNESSLVGEVDITSVFTQTPSLAEKLLSAEWFNPERFPKASLRSSQITLMPARPNDDRQYYYADCTLTILGINVPVTLNFIVEQADGARAVAVGRMVIQRSDFGFGKGEWAGHDALDNIVSISFRMVGEAD